MEQKDIQSSLLEVRDEDISSSGVSTQSSTNLAPRDAYTYRERIRTILAISAVFLLFLVLLAYIVIRDVAVLGIGTLFVTVCGGVTYRHYFSDKNDE
jgi:hypothetical protein